MAFHFATRMVLLLALAVTLGSADDDKKQENVAGEILTRITNDYDDAYPPQNVELEVDYYLTDFRLDESKQEIVIGMYLRQKWKDPQLSFENDSAAANIDRISVNRGYIVYYWMPDLFIPNVREVSKIHVPTPNQLMFIYKNGTVLTSFTLHATVPCKMNYQRFPRDIQRCSWSLELFSSTAQQIKISWKNATRLNDMRFHSRVDTPLMSLIKVEHVQINRALSTGDYEELKVTWTLQRHFGFYFRHCYLPCIFLVVMAYATYWLDRLTVRLAWILCLVLTMCTLSLTSQQKVPAPQVSYATGTDVYLGCCFAFVFLALFETAMLSWNSSGRDQRRVQLQNEHIQLEETPAESSGLGDLEKNKRCLLINKYGLDTIMKVLYPATFLIFNIIYWIFYG